MKAIFFYWHHTVANFGGTVSALIAFHRHCWMNILRCGYVTWQTNNLLMYPLQNRCDLYLAELMHSGVVPGLNSKRMNVSLRCQERSQTDSVCKDHRNSWGCVTLTPASFSAFYEHGFKLFYYFCVFFTYCPCRRHTWVLWISIAEVFLRIIDQHSETKTKSDGVG